MRILLFVLLFLTSIAVSLLAVIITAPSTSTVQFSWYTESAVVCKVYIYSENTSKELSEATPSVFHSMEASELSPDTQYKYRIECDATKAYIQAGSFSIPLNPGNNFSFVVYGDSRSNPRMHAKVAEAISKKKPLFVMHTGDIVYSDERLDDWADFFQATVALGNALFFPVIGNHERTAENYKRFFSLPGNESYYSFKVGELLFIALNTNERFDSYSKQYKWLKSLLSTEKAEFTVVILHHPPFSYGPHGDSYYVKNFLVPLFEQYGIDLVISGHDHNYQRIVCNNLTYIVTGGGGASIYKIKDPSGIASSFEGYNFVLFEYNSGVLKGICYDINGHEIDSFTISSH
ncbi:purple acid phosphatase family protein [Kosmotoga pacifica]|uniref:purple acid phosphatase family protein n=1 Tax=Kosmotoga pacifica TaxID=1330330 RepID=UPI00147002FE|nr:metallophosphoesterase family protein [Kosmotoga pacifica]